MDLSRRDFTKAAVLGSMAAGATGVLSACGSASTASTATAASAKPRAGGTLRAAISGGTSSDTLDPLNAVNNADFARVGNLFEPLLGLTPDAQPAFILATELTPNKDATQWVVRLRQGVTFHNGKEMTADDVIYTFQTILNPKAPAAAAVGLASIDLAGLRKMDRYTVLIPCAKPFATLQETLSIPTYSSVIPVDFDPKTPVGTGPFKLVSFTAGEQSVFTRYDGYWQTGRPYLDEVVITDYSDETTQVSALEAGQVDVANLLSADVIPGLQSRGKNILVSQGGGWNPFTMRVDSAPFNDVRVRQAMRLIVNRPQMLELVFAGHGSLGNDLFGIWAAEYDHDLPQRHQDIGQAKALLKAAGQDGMTVELVTADLAEGVLLMAQVFAQQASEAGVTVKVKQVTVSDFYGPSYLKWAFAQDFWYYNFYLPQASLAELPAAPFNETHFRNPAYNKLYAEAIATVDQAKRTELAHEMQRIEYDEGGYIIPFFPGVFDGYGPNVHGLEPSKGGLSLNGYDFTNIWLS
jgi:peptide/nickel transport system substrate-binding protein